MIALVEGAQRQKTPNEIALTILLAALTIIFLLTVVALQPMAIYSGAQQSLVVLIALLVCLIPTTIGALLSAIGIAGMDRLVQRNVLAMSGRAVEAAGDVDTLLLDKTGTITFGNRQATALVPAPGCRARRAGRRRAAVQPGRRDPRGPLDRRARQGALRAARRRELRRCHAEFVPFTAQTRMSGVDLDDGQRRSARAPPTRCGAGSRQQGGTCPDGARRRRVDGDRAPGRHPAGRRRAATRRRPRVLGVVDLKDVVKPGMRRAVRRAAARWASAP